MENYDHWNRPLASAGLLSFRCRCRYGWVMIGAKDPHDALAQARLSDQNAARENLQMWDESATSYVPLASAEPTATRS